MPAGDAERVSARSILQTFALAFPENPAAGATTYNSRIGLQGNLRRMLDRVPRRGSTAARRCGPCRGPRRLELRTPAGRQGPYRYVVMNAPPASPQAAAAAARVRDATALLERFRYFDSRLLIHRDPAYMYPDREYWTAYNAGVDGRQCEGSAWVGALHDPLPSGATVDVFKSWAQRRHADPKRILLERRFEHPLITPRAIAAARALRPLQGRRGLYFSGAYTTGSDLQETALYSAMKVAEAVAPASPKLASLQARIQANGLAGSPTTCRSASSGRGASARATGAGRCSAWSPGAVDLGGAQPPAIHARGDVAGAVPALSLRLT